MAGLFGQLGHRFVSGLAVSLKQYSYFHGVWIRVEFGHVGPGRKGCGCVPMGAFLVVGLLWFEEKNVAVANGGCNFVPSEH